MEKVLPHTLQMAHVVQEKPKLRTIKRKLTLLELQFQVDQEVEKLIDQARLTTAAQIYDKDWKEGLTEVGTNPKPPANKTCIRSSNIPRWSR